MNKAATTLKNLVIPVGGFLLALAFASFDFGHEEARRPLDNAPAAIEAVTEDLRDKNSGTGEIFSAPIPIVWKAEVVGCLVGCSGYILKRTDTGEEDFFQAYNADGSTKDLKGEVVVTGMWVGVDCGYSNTVFGGACVPSVVASEIIPGRD